MANKIADKVKESDSEAEILEAFKVRTMVLYICSHVKII
jgi:hypothetical protein